MNVIDKIKENYAVFSAQEKKLADYIIQHPQEVPQYTAQYLAQVAGVSSATVIRFTKRIGYRGYYYLKLDLDKVNSYSDFSTSNIIEDDDTTEELINKSNELHKKNLDLTAKLLDADDVKKATDLLLNARSIYLVGVGGSGTVCEDFRMKLSKIHKNVFFHLDINSLLTQLSYIGEEDVLFAVSYSGNTAEVNACVELAKNRNAKIISITRKDKNVLAKLSDIVLYIPKEEDDSSRLGAIYSRFSSLFVTDILYYGVAKENPDATQSKVKLTSYTDGEFAKYLYKNSLRSKNNQ